MQKKFQMMMDKRLEKGTQKMRARTPDTALKIVY
jgi:hypothetical protein